MPRNGTLNGISAYFSTTVALSVIGNITIRARVYASATPNNVFNQIASVELRPSLNGIISVGHISSVTATLPNIHVTAGTRLLLVFSAESEDGLDLATLVVGYASAGLSIV
jgi:BclB C-terminal domain-containing protein